MITFFIGDGSWMWLYAARGGPFLAFMAYTVAWIVLLALLPWAARSFRLAERRVWSSVPEELLHRETPSAQLRSKRQPRISKARNTSSNC